MTPSRTFQTRLAQLAKKGTDPILLIPLMELMEETLIDFQNTCMVDKEIAADEKGRLATTLTPLLLAVRHNRELLLATRQKPEPQKYKLRNAHLDP